jgi:hypothetical protein
MTGPDETLLAELENNIRHLYHLLDTLCETQFNVSDRERCDALLWIARERANTLRRDAHAAIWPGDIEQAACMTGGQRNG